MDSNILSLSTPSKPPVQQKGMRACAHTHNELATMLMNQAIRNRMETAKPLNDAYVPKKHGYAKTVSDTPRSVSDKIKEKISCHCYVRASSRFCVREKKKS